MVPSIIDEASVRVRLDVAGVEQEAAAAGARAGAAFAAAANTAARIVPTINTSVVNAAVNRVTFPKVATADPTALELRRGAADGLHRLT